jgi:O-glycosyl hydrolase
MSLKSRDIILAAAATLLLARVARAQVASVTMDTSPAGQRQAIDGFGTCLYGTEGVQNWWQNLYYGDLQASMLRMDLTPVFNSSYSANAYNSPGYDQPGPHGNYVRTYTNATSYTNLFNGTQAQIAVMGPNIDSNITCFDFTGSGSTPQVAGQAAQAGKAHINSLGDFKLFGSLWSPAPWLKLVDGQTYSGSLSGGTLSNVPFPFIWLGNFAGGVLDTSGTARPEFDDSSLGGTGPTSALTQFARCTAAYLRGFQNTYGVPFYAISIQNELDFDEPYNSCNYPDTAGYVAAIEAVRAELDQYPDLAGIKIMGPEDVLGGDYAMWCYGPTVAKNLQFVQAVGASPVAAGAEAFFCIHDYDVGSVEAGDPTPITHWNWWVDGWTTSLAPGIAANVHGFSYYGKKSWQTEHSGDDRAWLSPSTGFPGNGAWSIALRIEQGLTVGQESAWAYWQMTDGTPVSGATLTDATALQNSPKYIAAKHFFRYIRPNSICVNATVTGSTALSASAFLQITNGTMTVVLINSSNSPVQAVINSPAQPAGIPFWQTFTSSNGSYWQTSTAPIANGSANVSVPGYGVVTLYGVAPSGLSLTWNNPAPITYGTALSSNQLNATANVPGTLVYMPTNGTVLEPGTNALSVIFTPTDTVDYSGATGTVSLVVLPAPPSVSGTMAANPVGYWRLNETNNPSSGTVVAVDAMNSFNGIYGAASADGVPGPRASVGFPGFGNSNTAARFTNGVANSYVTLPPLNLNTNTVTITAWIYPIGTPASACGLVYCRPSGDASGLSFSTGGQLGYTWNQNNADTWTWLSGLVPPLQQWSFVALVISPAKATIYLCNTKGVHSAANAIAHTAEAFNAPTLIGGDSYDGGNGGRTFNGMMDEVAIFNTALMPAQVLNLYSNAAAVVTWTKPGRIIYGTALSTNQLDAIATVPGTFAYTPANGTVLNSGDYTLSVIFTPANTVDYSSITDTVSLVVSAAPLTVMANNQTKTYGQTVIFAGTEFATGGLVNGDTVSSATLTSPGSGATATVAGSPYKIVPSAAQGTGLANYIITYLNGALTVNPAALTITANNQTKTFGQAVTFAGTEFTAGGLVNSDTVSSVTLTSSGAAATATVAGSPYTIVPSGAVGIGLANYVVSLVNGTLTVSQATPTVTWTSPAPIIYGTALSSNELDATVSVPGGLAYTPTNGTVLGTGTNALSVVFTPSDTVDYSSLTDSVSLVVSPALLTVTAASASRPYGQTNPVFTGTIIGVTNGDNITAIYTCSATASSPAGTYPIVPSLVDPSDRQTNYTVSLVNGTLAVSHATPTVAWTNPAPIIYGTALSSNELDATVGVTGSLAYTPTNGAVLDTGTNALFVVFTPSDTADYSSLTDSVSLVVSTAPLTVTSANASRPYGEPNPVFTGTITGVTNGDNITAIYSCSATAGSPAGTYPIVPSLVDPSDRQTNYTVSLVNGTLAVSQATPTVTWTNPAPIIYGTALSSNELDATVSVPGSLAYTPTSGTVLDTGTNALFVVFTPTDTVDYSGLTDSVSLVVSPALLTVTAANASRPYGQTNPVFTGTIIGVTNGDNITAIYTCSATAGSPAGTYPIVPSLVDPNDRQTNYTVSLINGTLTVGQTTPQISLQPTNQSVVPGGSAAFSVGAAGSAPLAYQWQFDGTNLTDATNATLVLNAVAAANAGSYDVVVTNAYGSVSSVTATLSVLGVPVSFVTSSGGIQYSNGQLHLTLSGLTGQGSVLIEASTNLTQWTPIFTNPPGFGTMLFVDPAATNFRYRYYRATIPGW